MNLYPIILALHNIVRWIVVVFAVLALVRAFRGWLGKRPWTDLVRRAGVFYGSAMDTQLLLGLLLYVLLSPITKAVFADFGAVMSDAGARFFAVEHLFYMFLAVLFAHLGSFFAKRASEPVAKHRLAAIWYTLSVLAVVLGMPWMRPLFPGL
jgi:hypothetical protein